MTTFVQVTILCLFMKYINYYGIQFINMFTTSFSICYLSIIFKIK